MSWIEGKPTEPGWYWIATREGTGELRVEPAELTPWGTSVYTCGDEQGNDHGRIEAHIPLESPSPPDLPSPQWWLDERKAHEEHMARWRAGEIPMMASMASGSCTLMIDPKFDGCES